MGSYGGTGVSPVRRAEGARLSTGHRDRFLALAYDCQPSMQSASAGIPQKESPMDTESEQNPPIQTETHQCGHLFGCGETKGTGVFREDIAESAFNKKSADRLLHRDEVNQEIFDNYLTARGRSRRSLLQASGFLGTLAAVGPWFTRLAGANDGGPANTNVGANQKNSSANEGKVHTVESNKETVHLGVFDTTLPLILTIDSGDTISYPNTWSHFLNQLQPGVPVEKLAEMRKRNPDAVPTRLSDPLQSRMRSQ